MKYKQRPMKKPFMLVFQGPSGLSVYPYYQDFNHANYKNIIFSQFAWKGMLQYTHPQFIINDSHQGKYVTCQS